MELTDDQRAKLDDELLAYLEAAHHSAEVRAIVSLARPEERHEQIVADERIDPKDFPSRSDYRRALIDRQQSAVKANVGETLEQLRRLDLDLQGGKTTHTLVVVGTASNFAELLKLNGVRRAELDRDVSLGTLGAPR